MKKWFQNKVKQKLKDKQRILNKALSLVLGFYIYQWHRLEKWKAAHSLYSCLENFMDTGTWWAIVHGVAETRIYLSDFHFQWLTQEITDNAINPAKVAVHGTQGLKITI